ncbi:NADH-quinone oxidoreductase subunit N [Buchnera aphidicola (Periphyllus testudinaceus)]|uniref:NADH-quinone oxidoreductase subunit N n=1 Tax=Buchnera aphidicola TaxID=9 RepID=UPI0034643DB6
MISMFKQFFFISPLLILSISIVLNLFIIIHKRNFFLSFLTTLFGLIFSLFFFILLINNSNINLKYFLFFQLSIFYVLLFFLGSIITCIISYIWLRSKSFNKEEFYLLLLISNIGGCLLFLCNNIFSLFIGIELLSLPLFGMISYDSSKNFKTLESAFKYFILSSISSIFLLLGISLIYLSSGTLNFFILKSLVSFSMINFYVSFFFGLMFILVSFFIKITVFPFYFWIPDIYEVTSFPVLIYFSNSIKIIFFVILSKLFFLFPYIDFLSVLKILKYIVFFSILIGSILALFQKNIKRLIGYSSIVSSGYLLIILIFLYNDNLFNEAARIYLLGYFLNSIVLFSSMTLISAFFKDKNSHSFKNYKGCFWKSYILSISIIISLFSMIGFPLTIGFFSKFYLLRLVVENHNTLFGISILFESVISLYYYINFIKIFFYKKKKYFINKLPIETNLYKFFKIVIFCLSLLIILIGFFPNFLKFLNYSV